MSKKYKNQSKSQLSKSSSKSQGSKKLTNSQASRLAGYGIKIPRIVAKEVSSFALGMLPFTVCVYSAIFLVHTYDLPLPPIAFAMPMAVIMLFLLKPHLENAAKKKNASAVVWQYFDNAIEKTADRLLFVMPLCFVPIGVGIVKDTSILIDAWFLLFLVIVPHTILVISLTIVLLKKLDEKKAAGVKKTLTPKAKAATKTIVRAGTR